MYFVMYQDDLVTTEAYKVFDDTDGAVDNATKAQLVKLLSTNQAVADAFANMELDGSSLVLKPLTLPIRDNFHDVVVEQKGDNELVIKHNGDEGVVPFSPTTTVVGFSFDDPATKWNLYVHDSVSGRGRELQVAL